MKTLVTRVAAVAAGVFMSVAAYANDFSLAFDNTLKVDDANGTTLLYLNADGSYTTDKGTAGKWTASDTEFCFIPDGQASMCSPLLVTDKGLGESWTSTSSDGSMTATFTLIAGR